MANTITPNMNLVVPGIGTEPGPTWGTDLNADLGILDQHNHSSGQGVQITPAGININADLTMNENNLIDVKTVNFFPLPMSLPGSAPNLGCIYVAGNELYYNDEAGNVVAITKTGSVNAGAGSITGLPSGTASASYSSGSKTFVWQSSTNTPANMDGGSFIFRDITANSHGVTVNAPTALASDYSLVWPLLPGVTSVMTLDTSGNMGTQTYDEIGQEMTSVGANAIEASRTTTTGSTVGIGGLAISGSSTNFGANVGGPYPIPVTNLSVTITTSGRPVKLSLQSDGSGNDAYVGGEASNSTILVTFGFFRGATQLNTDTIELFITTNGGLMSINHAPSSVGFVDIVAAGTHTYTFQISNIVSNITPSAFVSYCVLTAYEL